MLIGIRSSAVPTRFADGKLRLLKEHGFDGVELSFNYEPDELDWRDAAAGRRMRKEKDALGLRFVAHAPDHLHLSDPDRSVVDGFAAELSAILAGIATFGAESAVVHADGYGAKPPLEGLQATQRRNLVHALKTVAKTCEAVNVRLLVETMTPGRITSELDTIIEAVDAVGSSYVGICLDVNHLNLSEDPADAIGRAAERIGEFHISDNHGEKEEHLMIGEGTIDWDAVAQAAAEIGFDGNLILETNTYDQQQYGCLLDAAAHASSQLARSIRRRR